jgi:3-demethoxyubiquinol 3-hydroxylase
LREVGAISPDSGGEGKKSRSKVAIIVNIQLFRCEYATHQDMAKAQPWWIFRMANLHESAQCRLDLTTGSQAPNDTSAIDACLSAVDTALRTLFSPARSSVSAPVPNSCNGTHDAHAEQDLPGMTAAECRHAAGLMRVNHVGEICAQALYSAQALGTKNNHLKRQFRQAAAEELNHLAWTEQRIKALGGRISLLNPVWYAGAFALGLLASRKGDATSLGFLQETEIQVAEHLRSHMQENGVALPLHDKLSRAVVAQMCSDEEEHALAAAASGAIPMPLVVSRAMKLMALLMTTTAYKI